MRSNALRAWAIAVLALAGHAASTQHQGQNKPNGKKPPADDPGALPNLDLDSLYYETTALSPGESLLLASTLDGHLVALNQETGDVVWDIRDEPVVKSGPYNPEKPKLPAFLPDPKDGSIYMIGGGFKDPLKKLPFTIPELVAASPCKSSDGILYTGKKVDTWISIDRYTGDRQGTMSFNGCLEDDNDQCPNLNPSNVLIGRTEYNILMHDSRGEGRRWNISFFDYSSNLAGGGVGPDDPDYDLVHFTDSSSGFLITLDRTTGAIQWEQQIGSPIVGLYKLEADGIVSVHFTSVSKETLANFMSQFNGDATDTRVIIGETKLYPTLYVGDHGENGLYAMPSLVDEQTLTIGPTTTGPLLLEGPQNFQMPTEINLDTISDKDSASAKNMFSNEDPLGIPLGPEMPNGRDKSTVLLFGYYQVPDQSTIKLSPAVHSLQLTSAPSSHHQLQHPGRGQHGHHHVHQHPFFDGQVDERGIVSNVFPSPGKLPSNYRGGDGNLYPTPMRDKDGNSFSSTYVYYEVSPRDGEDENEEEYPYDVKVIEEGLEQLKGLNITFVMSTDFSRFFKEVLTFTKEAIKNAENKELKAICVLLVVMIYSLFQFMKRLTSTNTSSSRRVGLYSNGSAPASSGSYGVGMMSSEVTAQAVELEDGSVRVGSIVFDPAQMLGKGCEGTFVFKGRFDNRDVAVKRVLNAEVGVADREVELLRESDQHHNVIRYFCMEQDRQFRYIALEFCQATLQDYVDGRYVNPNLDAVTVLKQATLGLQHLHFLEIVHRDIKPQNVLISMPGKRGEVRAMISDFGLCKKLKVGRMSFSRRSGVAGTEGWIAPEMMDGDRSNTCAVDIFSLGCVYYFVLSNGHHPFGGPIHRQGNIQRGVYDLSKLDRDITAKSLLERMIQRHPRDRPSTSAVLKHPFFWSRERVLAFLQDVSDRVDKEDGDAALVETLERGRADVVRGNWHEWLDEKVREDLRKHRTYNGRQVRDLLRALRNKKHHYNELGEEIKAKFGRIPDQFVFYWTSRFPRLLVHSWHAMHPIKSEPTFQKYFDKDYDFLQDDCLPKTLPVEAKASVTETETDPDESNHYRPTMSLVPETSSSFPSVRNPPEAAANLFEPDFLRKGGGDGGGDGGGGGGERFFPTTAAGADAGGGDRSGGDDDEDRASVLSKWDDWDSSRLNRNVTVEESRDDDDDFHEMHPAERENSNDDGGSPFLLVANGQTPLIDVPKLEQASPRKMPKVVQLQSDARQERLADFEKCKAANKPSWSEAVQNITAEDKVAKLETRPTQVIAEEMEDAVKKEDGDKDDAGMPNDEIRSRMETEPDAAFNSPTELEPREDPSEVVGNGDEAEEVEEDKPKWIVDDRVTAEGKKKANKKKKKKKPTKAP